MIDLTTETPIRLQEVARLAGGGKSGRPCVHTSTALRWILRGLPCPSGKRVRLEAIRVGGHWVTTREAVQRWSEALTPRLDDDPAAAPRTPSQRERASARAARRLEAARI